MMRRIQNLLLARDDCGDAATFGRASTTAPSEALSGVSEEEHARAMLTAIGDAVVSTDVIGRIVFFNPAAERMTGWSREAAVGRPLDEVLRIIDGTTREAAQSAMALAIRGNRTVGLPQNCVLIRADAAEVPIEDSAAPIHGHRGEVIGAVMVFRDVSAVRALTLKLSHLAQHDSLTDLPNRTLFNDRLTQAIGLARRHGTRLTVLFLDLDHFKRINDTLGHGIGDKLLQSVAHRLLGCVRGSDTVSRQGGDEFVILLSDTACVRDAAIAAEKILAGLRAPLRIAEHDVNTTASMGIATYPEDGTDAATLMERADTALLHAKGRGRNNYQFFKPDMNVCDGSAPWAREGC